jgi:Uma2 family endonuclease
MILDGEINNIEPVMTALPQPSYGFEEYLTTEREQQTRNEFVAGEVYAMTGAKENHNLIVTNLIILIGTQFKQRPCRVYASDMKVRIDEADACTYPDVIALCGERQYYDQRRDVITNPTLIVEVLSESTEAYDRGDKFALYRHLPSLQEYLLLSQERMAADLYSRQTEGRWLLSNFEQADQEIPLESLQCSLPMAEIYDKVEFDRQAERARAD